MKVRETKRLFTKQRLQTSDYQLSIKFMSILHKRTEMRKWAQSCIWLLSKPLVRNTERKSMYGLVESLCIKCSQVDIIHFIKSMITKRLTLKEFLRKN